MKPSDHPRYRKNGLYGHQVDNTIIDGLIPDAVDIGHNFTSAPGSWIIAHDSSLCPTKGKIIIKDTVVGDNVFLGLNSIVMPGTTIGNNVIIGANSTVTKDVPDGELWAGNPARKVSTTEEYYIKATNEDGKSLYLLDKITDFTAQGFSLFKESYYNAKNKNIKTNE
tara:strand:- start:79 stop:579 length:501 start_codon:yes stop_codon:yes gene_type:complete